MEPLNLSSTQVPLKELLRRFDVGEYRLPAFQRPFVWRIRQTLNLLDSLLRGYPISVIYLWEPDPGSSKLVPKPRTFNTKRPERDLFKAYIIDGQQRLTSLHAAFGYAEAFDEVSKRSLECWLDLVADDDREGNVTRLFQSPAQKQFLATEDAQQRPRRVRLKDLLEGTHQEVRSEREQQLRLAEFPEEQIQEGLRRIDAAYRMLTTPITCITITQSADDEVLQVFKRLNRGGTGLKDRDVRAADLGIGRSVEVLHEIQAFVNEPLPRALGFGFSFAFRALVVFHKGSAQFNSLTSRWADGEGDRGQSLGDSWSEASAALQDAMKLVEQVGWCRRPLLPSCNMLIPLAYALKVHRGRRTEADEQLILRWMCLSTLRGVFKGSVETTINKHLRKVKEVKTARGLLDALTVNQRRPIQAGELLESTSVWGPFSQVMFAWLVAQNANDWLSGESLYEVAKQSLGTTHPEESLTVQHIFPRKYLSDYGYDQKEANCSSNFAIIGRRPNSSLKDLPPLEALQRLDSLAKKERARMQFFSNDAADLLKPERYSEFRNWRSRRLAEAWNEWLGVPAS